MDKKPGRSRGNPLDMVGDITTPENAPGSADPKASVAATRNITAQAQALNERAKAANAQGGAVDPRAGAQDASREQAEIEERQGRVDKVLEGADEYPEGLIPPEVLAELEGYKTYLRMNNLQVTAQKAAFEDEIKAYERNKAIEKRLEPLRITELFMRSNIEQTIPIIPGQLEVTVRSLSGRMRLLLRDMLWKEVLAWAHAKADTNQESEIVRHLNLAVQVASLTGGQAPWPYPAEDISRLVSKRDDQSEARAREMIQANMHWWQDRPEEMAIEIYGHVLAFEVRMRRLLRLSGWEDTVKK